MCDLNLSSPLSHPVLPPLLHVCPQFRVCWGLGSTLPLNSPQGKYLRQGLPEWGEAVQGLSKSKVPKGMAIWGEYGTGSLRVLPLLRTWILTGEPTWFPPQVLSLQLTPFLMQVRRWQG